MKTKNISILLFILVFAGIALLGSTPARAGDWDRECDDLTTAANSCALFGYPAGAGHNTQDVWALKAFVGFDADGNEIPASLNNWPLCDSANNVVVFQYIAGPFAPATKPRSAVSYLVMDWFEFPLPGGDPGGAAIDISQFVSLFGDCEPNLDDGLAYKVNASVNNKTDAIITIPMPLGTGVNLNGQAWTKWSSDCDRGIIWTAKPAEAGFSATEPSVKTYNNCAGTTVTVTFDVCRRVESVLCGNDTAVPVPDAKFCRSDNQEIQDDCFEIVPNTTGSMLCTSPPIFTYGEQMWFCP